MNVQSFSTQYHTEQIISSPDHSHAIRSVIAEKALTHANLTVLGLSFVEPELWAIKVLHCAIGISDFFSCDLVLDPMTFM